MSENTSETYTIQTPGVEVVDVTDSDIVHLDYNNPQALADIVDRLISMSNPTHVTDIILRILPGRSAVFILKSIYLRCNNNGSISAKNITNAVEETVSNYDYDIAGNILLMFTSVKSLVAEEDELINFINLVPPQILALLFSKLALMKLIEPPIFSQDELRKVMMIGINKVEDRPIEDDGIIRPRDPKNIWNDMTTETVEYLHRLVVRCDIVDKIIESFLNKDNSRVFCSNVIADMCQNGDSHTILKELIKDELKLNYICDLIRQLYFVDATRIIEMLGLSAYDTCPTATYPSFVANPIVVQVTGDSAITTTQGVAMTETSVTTISGVNTTVVSSTRDKKCHIQTSTNDKGFTEIDVVGNGITTTTTKNGNHEVIVVTTNGNESADSNTIIEHDGTAYTSTIGNVSINTGVTVTSCNGTTASCIVKTEINTLSSDVINTTKTQTISSEKTVTVTTTVTSSIHV